MFGPNYSKTISSLVETQPGSEAQVENNTFQSEDKVKQNIQITLIYLLIMVNKQFSLSLQEIFVYLSRKLIFGMQPYLNTT